MTIGLVRDHENFPDPKFALGEWVADGLILGIRYDPSTRLWHYYVEAPELDPPTRWLLEDHMER